MFDTETSCWHSKASKNSLQDKESALGHRSRVQKWHRAVDPGALTPRMFYLSSHGQHGRDTHLVKDLGPRRACRFFLFVVVIVIDAF